MDLIERKCPNCGAGLEFNESDKSCTCQYCKRTFEIKRDLTDADKIDLIYNKVKEPIKYIVILHLIIPIIVVIVVLILVIGIIFAVVSQLKNNENSIPSVVDKVDEIKDEVKDKFEDDLERDNELLENVNELSGSDFDSIDIKARMSIDNGKGINDLHHSYIKEDITREKLYVAYKDEENYVVPIYKAIYYDFYHRENRYTVFVPLVFKNVKKDLFNIGNAKLSAPEYYFNEEKTSYTYGYVSLEDAYNGVISPLEGEYQITSE